MPAPLLGSDSQCKSDLRKISRNLSLTFAAFFDDPATDPGAALHHILWDRWTEDEIGENQFIGRLFNERGQIYHGCTAFDAATYTIQHLAALGGEVCSAHQP